ncbi:unnamed protein product [Owenia fusiformis]|uniref:Uncharacterized protein n=1 Tax=Owenia fusiformis TaxID=6347 RepID=A0A8J1TVH3_OWEFU|nr:unnamed protein product [Owenia fusiformis]
MKMDLLVHLIWITTLTCVLTATGGELCENDYVETRLENCTSDIAEFLRKARENSESIHREDQENELCSYWNNTDLCLLRLERQCSSFVSQKQIDGARQMFTGDTFVCDSPEVLGRLKNAECYAPYVTLTRKCTREFDNTYLFAVLKDDFKKACMSAVTLMECFHDNKLKITADCGRNASSEYHQNFVPNVFTLGIRRGIMKHCMVSIPEQLYQEFIIQNENNSSNRVVCGILTFFTIYVSLFL